MSNTADINIKNNLKKYWYEFLILCRWIMGLVIIVLDCSALYEYSAKTELTLPVKLLQFIFLLILGLIVLPPIDKKINLILNFWGRLSLKYFIYYFLLMLGVYIGNTSQLNIESSLAMMLIPLIFFILTSWMVFPIFIVLKTLIYIKNKVVNINFIEIKNKVTANFLKIKNNILDCYQKSINNGVPTIANIKFWIQINHKKIFNLKTISILLILALLLMNLPAIFNAFDIVITAIFSKIVNVINYVTEGITTFFKFIIDGIVLVFKFIVEIIKIIFALIILYIVFFIIGIICRIVK